MLRFTLRVGLDQSKAQIRVWIRVGVQDGGSG